jgi:hypothetical protein
MRDHFDLHIGATRQCRHLDGGACREVAGEIGSVNFVHAAEVSEVGQENSRFDDIGEVEILICEDDFHVFEDTLGLGFDVASNQVSIGVERNLPSAKEHVAHADSVVIRSGSRRRFLRFNHSFGHKGMFGRLSCQCCYSILGHDEVVRAGVFYADVRAVANTELAVSEELSCHVARKRPEVVPCWGVAWKN